MPRHKVPAPSRRGDMSLDILFYRTCPVCTLSLTMPAVARVFSYSHHLDRTHFLVGARMASVSGAAVHLLHPKLLSPLRSSIWCCPPVISSITNDHDEFFDLPFQGGG